MSAVTDCQAFVLHRRAYQESSWMLTCLTEDHGKIQIIAKGAKRPKSLWRGILEPFQPLSIDCCGRQALKTLTRADVLAQEMRLQGHALLSGLYLNEMIYKALSEPWVPVNCFKAYQSALTRLRSGKIQWALRPFEYHLLTALGYGMSLTCDHHGDRIDPKRYYHWRESEGFCPLYPNEISPYGASGEALLALSQDSDDEALLASLKPLLQAALTVHIQSEIKTRALWVSG